MLTCMLADCSPCYTQSGLSEIVAFVLSMLYDDTLWWCQVQLEHQAENLSLQEMRLTVLLPSDLNASNVR